MKVLHIVRQFSPSVGGLEDSVRSLASIQRSTLGIDARVLTLNRVFSRPERLPETGVVDGVPVRRIGWTGSTRYPLAPSVERHLADVDLIHVHAIDFFFDFLALTKPLHRRPMIASTHGGFFHSGAYSRLKDIWFQTITRASLHAYHRIVACSYNDADLFSGIAKKRLTTIENGINQQKFRNAASPTPVRTIVSFGRFAQHKRIDLLFELLHALRVYHPDWNLIVAGRPANLSHADLIGAARKAGVADSVRFVLDPDDVALRDVLGHATYFGCLSEHEGFGLAAVEALSAGLIPILSTIAPFRRLVGQTGLGVLVSSRDFDTAAREIETLHETSLATFGVEPSVRTRAMTSANHYDWADVARRYVEVYQNVLTTRGPRGRIPSAPRAQ